ncbi:unnamed protein product [Dibothriocephalus latus]|uniref:Uncharacterized protein n=1 Tax=Dibothriocephalus latus TaxID=60516 RepID=A0A3P7LU98_DIBLA|nr:unnamed protein product [Dibothriocephalus latus]
MHVCAKLEHLSAVTSSSELPWESNNEEIIRLQQWLSWPSMSYKPEVRKLSGLFLLLLLFKKYQRESLGSGRQYPLPGICTTTCFSLYPGEDSPSANGLAGCGRHGASLKSVLGGWGEGNEFLTDYF